jgi:hypothetical protein
LRIFIILLFTLGLSIASAADDKDAPEIQTIMAPEDFSASGLDKLTDAERAHLSGWVARYRDGAIKGPPVPGKQREEAAAAAAAQKTTQVAAQEAAPEATSEVTSEATPTTTDEYPNEYTTQPEKQEKKDKKIKYELVAKVVPAFRGWAGKSVFVLDNGQVWRQRTPGSLRYSGNDSTVIITQNFLGKFVMKHQATGRAIGVRRID